MKYDLIKLSKYLNSINFKKEAMEIYTLTKLAIPSHSEQEMKLFQSPKYQKYLMNLLRAIGLKSEIKSAIYLINSGAYLKEGITERNLILSAITVAALIPGLESLEEILKNPNMPLEKSKPLANLILQNQGKIQNIFKRFKQNKFIPHLTKNVTNGIFLVEYCDRMWNSLRNWTFLILSKDEPGMVSNEMEKLEELAKKL